jgi:hypothetical protein
MTWARGLVLLALVLLSRCHDDGVRCEVAYHPTPDAFMCLLACCERPPCTEYPELGPCPR